MYKLQKMRYERGRDDFTMINLQTDYIFRILDTMSRYTSILFNEIFFLLVTK